MRDYIYIKLYPLENFKNDTMTSMHKNLLAYYIILFDKNF